VKKIFDKSNLETAEAARRLEISIRFVAHQSFFKYRAKQTAHGKQLFRNIPRLKLLDVFTRSLVFAVSDLMRRRRAVFFGQQLFKAGSQRRFDDAFSDDGTVHDMNYLPLVITNKLCLNDIMPPELRE
jgi:hypothetical protein